MTAATTPNTPAQATNAPAKPAPKKRGGYQPTGRPSGRPSRERVENIIWRRALTGEDTNYFVAWDIEDIEIPAERLRELVQDAGISKLRLPVTKERTSVRRALASMAKEMGRGRDIDVRQLDSEEEGVDVWTIIYYPRVDATRRVKVEQRVTVTLRRNPLPGEAPLEFDPPEAQAEVAPLIRRYQKVYTARDISTHLLAAGVYHAGGIKMRGQGGFYFVPATGAEGVERMRVLVDLIAREVGTRRIHLSTVGVAPTGDERQDALNRDGIRWHSYNALLAEIRSAYASLRDMLRDDRVNDDGMSKVQPDTAKGYMDDARNIMERAGLYREVADLGLSHINGALKTLYAAFDAVRGGLSLTEFDATLNRVDRAISAAEEAEPHEATGPEDDPFAELLPEPAPVNPVMGGAVAADAAAMVAADARRAGAEDDPFADDDEDDD